MPDSKLRYNAPTMSFKHGASEEGSQFPAETEVGNAATKLTKSSTTTQILIAVTCLQEDPAIVIATTKWPVYS